MSSTIIPDDYIEKLSEVIMLFNVGAANIWHPISDNIDSFFTKNKNKYVIATKAIYDLSVEKGISIQKPLFDLIKIIKEDKKNYNLQKVLSTEAKMSAKVLILLPFLSIILGMIIGANPLKILFFTKSGILLLFGGLFVIYIGTKITNKMIKNSKIDFDTNKLLTISLLENALLSGLSMSESLFCMNKLSQNNIYANDLYKIGVNLKNGNSFMVSTAELPNTIFYKKLIKILQLIYDSGITATVLFENLYNSEVEEIVNKTNIATQKLSVKLMFPLGLCFLPSFVILGLIPILISFASKIQ
jgi:tight adherence protein B